MPAATTNYKDNLLSRIGGSYSLNFLVISWCKHIQEDSSLKEFYGDYSLDNLTGLQQKLLMAAFVEPANKAEAKNLRSRVTMQHYRLFESGLNETHFDKLSVHFSSALRDCWQSNDVIEDCEKYFKELRSLFHGNGFLDSASSHRRLSDALMENVAMKAIEEYERSKSEDVLASGGDGGGLSALLSPKSKKRAVSIMNRSKSSRNI